MLSRRAFSVGVAAAGLGLSGNSLASDSYPRRAIKIVVPFPPGTASEFFVRLIADGLQTKFGQPVIVENRPGGAGGTTGAATVANAAPDGYTLLASPPGPLVTANIIYKTIDYDPQGFLRLPLLYATLVGVLLLWRIAAWFTGRARSTASVRKRTQTVAS